MSISTELARIGHPELQRLIESAEPGLAGLGGSSVRLAVGGLPVFVKLVPLTEMELRPSHYRSTANLFELPTYFQYGIGSVGFGAWRELAAHVMATDWVLAKASTAFPLLHHWRVIPALKNLPSSAEEPDYFEGDRSEPPGSREIRARMASIRAAPARLALFLEWFPHHLHEWLSGELRQGGEGADRAVRFVEEHLDRTHAFMAEEGFVHFDTHFRNILTDGDGIYFSDFGLASCRRFELGDEERAFLAAHGDYDRCRSATSLVHSITASLGDGRPWADQLEDAALVTSAKLSGAVRDALGRHAPVAVAMLDFRRRLRTEGKMTPYPRRALAERLRS